MILLTTIVSLTLLLEGYQLFLVRKIMATVEDVKTTLVEIKDIVTNVVGDVDSLIAQVAALKEQIDNGTLVTQEDLDAIAASASEIKNSLSAIDEKEPPA